MTKMHHKCPKYPKNLKMTKMPPKWPQYPPKLLNDQNTLETFKITKIPSKPLKMIKIPLSLKNDINNLKTS